MKTVHFMIGIMLFLSACTETPPKVAEKPKRLTVVEFDLSGSVDDCETTLNQNKAAVAALADRATADELFVLITFRSRGQPKQWSWKMPSLYDGPPSSRKKVNAARRKADAQAVGKGRAFLKKNVVKTLEAEISSRPAYDDSTDIVGALSFAYHTIRQYLRKNDTMIAELHMFSDGLHTRGTGFSGKFNPKNYSLYLERFSEHLAGATLPDGVKVDLVSWKGAHVCGLEKLSHQEVIFLHSEVEKGWDKYFADNSPGTRFEYLTYY